MPLFLYDLPNWLLGVLISGGAAALVLGAYFALFRMTRADFTNEERGLAMSVLGVVATVNSLLLAFSAVSVWEAFGAAEEAVVHEADTIGELERDLAVFDSGESRRARTQLRAYTQLVVDEEWTAMRQGGASPAA